LVETGIVSLLNQLLQGGDKDTQIALLEVLNRLLGQENIKQIIRSDFIKYKKFTGLIEALYSPVLEIQKSAAIAVANLTDNSKKKNVKMNFVKHMDFLQLLIFCLAMKIQL